MSTKANVTATSATVEINGFALRWGRKLMNISPASLAASIGRDRTYIVKIETGAVSRVSTETFEALVKTLKIEDRRALLASPQLLEAAG